MEQPSKRRKIAQNGDPTPYTSTNIRKEARSSNHKSFLVRNFREREIRRSREQQRFYRRQDVAVHTVIQMATVEVLGHIGDDGLQTPVTTIQPTPSPEPVGLPGPADLPPSPPPPLPPSPPEQPGEPGEPGEPAAPAAPGEPGEPVAPGEPGEPAVSEGLPPSEDAGDPSPEPEHPADSPPASDGVVDEPSDGPISEPLNEPPDQPPHDQPDNAADEPKDEPEDAIVGAADESGSDEDIASSGSDGGLSPSDATEDSADDKTDESASSDKPSGAGASEEPTIIILPDDLPTDATLLTTRVTFSDESTTWTRLLTIDLESVITIDALATATSSGSPGSAETSTNSSSPTSAITASTSGSISLPDGLDQTGGVIVVATRGVDTAGEESDNDGGGSGDSVDTPEVVGGVVGGIAGLAVILLVALLILRWYRNHRQSSQALPGSEDDNRIPDTRSTKPLAESAFAGSAAGLFKRLSGVNKRSPGARTTPPMAQRSFERISGRKLPSAFSPALVANTSPGAASAGTSGGAGAGVAVGAGTYSRTRDISRPVVNPAAAAVGAGTVGTVSAAATTTDRDSGNDDDEDATTNLSDTSSYRDSRTNPFLPAGGLSSPGAGQASGLDETETIRPSPARTPVIHAASGPPYQQNPYSDTLSPPVTPVGQQSAGLHSSGGGGSSSLGLSGRTGQSSPRPTRPGGGTLGRSLPSFDGSRSSRFTEDV